MNASSEGTNRFIEALQLLKQVRDDCRDSPDRRTVGALTQYRIEQYLLTEMLELLGNWPNLPEPEQRSLLDEFQEKYPLVLEAVETLDRVLKRIMDSEEPPLDSYLPNGELFARRIAALMRYEEDLATLDEEGRGEEFYDDEVVVTR